MRLLHRVLVSGFIVGLGFSITLSESTLAALTVLWLWQLRDPDVRLHARWPLLGPALAFSALTLASALASGSVMASLWSSKKLLLIAVLYVVANTFERSQVDGSFLLPLGVVSAAAAAVGLVQTSFCVGHEPGHGNPEWFFHHCHRARGFFSIYMTLAGVLSLTLLATFPWAFSAPKVRWWFLAWWTMLAGFIATYSRGAWMGFVSGLLVMRAAIPYRRWLLVGGLAVAVVLGAVTLAPYGVSKRIHRMVYFRDDKPVQERLHMWESGLEMWREHPWLGHGPGGVKRDYHRFAHPDALKQRTGHLHNTLLQILVERGLLGLLAWLAIFGAFFRQVGRQLRRAAASERALLWRSLAAIIAFLAAGLTEYNFGDSEVVMVAWAIMALPFTRAETAEATTRHPAAPAAVA